MKNLLAVGVVAVVVSGVAGCGSSPSALTFGACPGDLAQRFPSMTCTIVEAPLDYAHPEGPSITLLASRIVAKDPAKRRGTLFVNPGGPGSSASARIGTISQPDANGVARLPAEVLDSYDLIGFDPRGVAHSSPISCVGPEFWDGPQPDPDDPANRALLWQRAEDFAVGCARRSGDVLPYLGTVNVARDMDLLRAKLGERTVSYFGSSYGTYLGAVYGELFPQRVDRMVLDAVIDPQPEALWFEAGFAQAPTLEARLNSWMSWTATYDAAFGLGSTRDATRAALDAALADFRSAPRGRVGVSELLGAVYDTLASEIAWSDLAGALSAYSRHHDDSALVEMATPQVGTDTEQSAAAATAVSCVDAAWPTDRAAYEARAAAAAAVSRFAWWNMWIGGAACAHWPGPHDARVRITGAGLPPILMFHTVGDPYAPYEGALAMHRAMPSSTLVTEADSGKHGAFASQQPVLNHTAQDIGAAYLVRGELPTGDLVIPGHAVPPAVVQHR